MNKLAKSNMTELSHTVTKQLNVMKTQRKRRQLAINTCAVTIRQQSDVHQYQGQNMAALTSPFGRYSFNSFIQAATLPGFFLSHVRRHGAHTHTTSTTQEQRIHSVLRQFKEFSQQHLHMKSCVQSGLVAIDMEIKAHYRSGPCVNQS
jgi:hypothetical protein